MIIVTGGAGLIGSYFVLWFGLETESMVVANKFTYAVVESAELARKELG